MSTPPGLAGALHDGAPVEPRPSACVLVLREGAEWELLMVRRPGGADFAPDVWVFPGGSVHAEDADAEDQFAAAAIRELFEEAGVLLASRGTAMASAVECDAVRDLVATGHEFRPALTATGLTSRSDLLLWFTRWITPEPVRRRFDTRFYLAMMPSDQVIRPQPGEVVDWKWVVPATALEDDDFNLVFATRRIMESIAGAATPAELIRAHEGREAPTVLPRLVETDNGLEIQV